MALIKISEFTYANSLSTPNHHPCYSLFFDRDNLRSNMGIISGPGSFVVQFNLGIISAPGSFAVLKSFLDPYTPLAPANVDSNSQENKLQTQYSLIKGKSGNVSQQDNFCVLCCLLVRTHLSLAEPVRNRFCQLVNYRTLCARDNPKTEKTDSGLKVICICLVWYCYAK